MMARMFAFTPNIGTMSGATTSYFAGLAMEDGCGC